ncbi:MAG TPA: site-specific integrase [Bryobacteraceae bacterium]|nr:site-specific integrase [Bryobacteraceae bacterium]
MAKRGQNEGSIFQRKDGRWVASLNLGWAEGRRVRKSYYGRTRSEVQGLLTKALADLHEGLPILNEKQTVSDYLSWWLHNITKSTIRPSTWTSYEELVRLHLRPAFEDVILTKLTPQHVRTFLNDKLNSGLSSRRVQYLHAVLRAALNAAIRDQLLHRNAAALVKPPRVTGKDVQPLTIKEARRFLDSIRGNRLEALFTVAVSLGLRQGEALGLRWRDIDFEAGTLRVRYALQRIKPHKDSATVPNHSKPSEHQARPFRFHLVEPKSKPSRRTIALPKLTLSALVEHKGLQDKERVLAGSRWNTPVLTCDGQKITVEDLVFVNRLGNPFDAPTVTHRFQILLKRAGIGHHRFHDLRHTAATFLAVQGVHPRAIQAALGWENLAMLNRYAHFIAEQRQAVASAMDSILTPVAVTLAVNTDESNPN